MSTKCCTKCKGVFPIENFSKHAGRKDGLSSLCKACKSELDAAYRLDNAEKIKDRYRRRLEENPNYHAEIYAKDPEKHRARAAAYQRENPDKVAKRNKRFREDNPNYGREWEAANADRVKKKRRKQFEKKMATPRGRLENSIKVGVHRGLSKGSKAGRKTFEILGYTSSQLKEHLEDRFLPGMTWENYGRWHVDHMIPRSAFNYETVDDIDFKRCWALENLRPMWAKENIRKGAKLDAPFQPSLLIATNDNKKNTTPQETTNG